MHGPMNVQDQEQVAQCEQAAARYLGTHDVKSWLVHVGHLTMFCLLRSNRTIARLRAASNMFGSSVRPILPTGSGTLADVCLVQNTCRI